MLMMNSIKINCKLSLPKATSNFQHLTCKLKQPAKHNKNNVCGSEALTSRWAHMDIWEVCTAEIQGFSFLFLVDCPPVTNECSRERGFPFAQLTKSWRGAEVDQNETVFWTSLGILRLFWQYNGFTMKKKQKTNVGGFTLVTRWLWYLLVFNTYLKFKVGVLQHMWSHICTSSLAD